MRKALFFLGVLSDHDVEWILSAGSLERPRAGSVLIRQGETIERLYLVLDGVLTVTVGPAPGRPIATLRAGEIVGEISLVDSRPTSATVTATEDSLALSIPRSRLAEKLREDGFASRFYHALALFLADRLRASVSRLGYGDPGHDADGGSDEEMALEALEHLTLAGARFEAILRRVREG